MVQLVAMLICPIKSNLPGGRRSSKMWPLMFYAINRLCAQTSSTQYLEEDFYFNNTLSASIERLSLSVCHTCVKTMFCSVLLIFRLFPNNLVIQAAEPGPKWTLYELAKYSFYHSLTTVLKNWYLTSSNEWVVPFYMSNASEKSQGPTMSET